ncbi:lipopolysaccharide export system ATP-binding protein [Thermosulfidibacter takaii ABI70S6]|uniref:Lipopolysaccharide export system ATP-binding protein LptB n=1 Tax=Thermosulfidibacter takaii (strain DSM 17441 / JCM 13301 / NBRC 103674 / ABI70S6) TaxID=1298851 RepID=A0A0S3QSD3_THET7|nr:LPS export ABC transporter ATP-binding protein [Thermosulfidibacter takaii]BAT71250.1 lipopolysaccharide export system ATP-binding protein [Thermosulfidibacter takaii ABI70S6]
MLEANNLRKSYGKREVVKGVDLKVDRGEVVGLLGPNGAGKTTTFYMIVGIIRPDDGTIKLDGEDITQLPMYIRARKGIGYLPQEPSVFRKLTVKENILSVLELLDVSEEERKERVDRLLKDFGLERVADVKGYALSGGERRRVEIARSLSVYPKYMLLDEPFAGLDPIAVADLQGLIRELKSRNIGVILTDHNVRETLKVTDRAYIISEGEVIAEGTPEEIASMHKVRDVYLGRDFEL